MAMEKHLSLLATVLVVVIVASVAVGAGIYFYILPASHGNYTGPGLPAQGQTYDYSLTVNGYGDWASYGFHSNVTNFYANITSTSLNNMNIETAIAGIMNETEYHNLESDTSIKWLISQGPPTDVTMNYHGSATGNYYLVILQEGNGGFTVGGTLTLTEEH